MIEPATVTARFRVLLDMAELARNSYETTEPPRLGRELTTYYLSQVVSIGNELRRTIEEETKPVEAGRSCE